MPKLDERLKAVAKYIRSSNHADVGADHGHLLKALLATNRIAFGIAVENKRLPFENAKQTLCGMHAVVRFADGLEGLAEGEVDSLSICGMGGEAIVNILETHPERVPDRLVVQPNCSAHCVRSWGLHAGWNLVDESIVDPSKYFQILVFARSTSRRDRHRDGGDSMYRGIDVDLGIEFGPHLLRGRNPLLRAMVQRDFHYLSDLPERTTRSAQRLELARRALELLKRR